MLRDEDREVAMGCRDFTRILRGAPADACRHACDRVQLDRPCRQARPRGAGNIGVALDSALNLFQRNRVAVILLAIFAVVIPAEMVVTPAPRRII